MIIREVLPQWFINFLIKKCSTGAAMLANKSAVKKENLSNRELSEERRKLIIRKFKKQKV